MPDSSLTTQLTPELADTTYTQVTTPLPPPSRLTMQPGRFDYEGATVRYQITSNAKHPNTRGPQIWALNVHGFFAGGGMYAHESRHLAKALGWRIVNPSLPGFGGSKPLPSDRVTPHEYAHVLAAMMDHLGIDQAVLLGHSMGGALALAFAQAYPERTLGIVYRDGAGTTAWRSGRAGLFARALNPISGGLADVVDTVTSAIWEIPTMFAGGYKEVGPREFLPDIRHNFQHIIDMLPVLRMLFGLDLAHAATDAVDVHGIPVLTMWGVWDKITPSSCATEFAHHTRTKMVWVPGGHSWMFAQPWEQASTLVSSQAGQEFVEAAIARLYSDPIGLPVAPATAV